MTPSSTLAPPRRRWWRVARLVLLSLAALVTLAALAVTIENVRGKRAWEHYKAEWEAKGEHFDLAYYMPKPVPPEQNFCALPYFQEVAAVPADSPAYRRFALNLEQSGEKEFPRARVGSVSGLRFTDWAAWQEFYRGNTNYPQAPNTASAAQAVLTALGRYQAQLDEFRAAAARPAAILTTDVDVERLLPAFGRAKALCQFLRFHAAAELAAGNPAEALADVRVGLRLDEALRGQPLLISQLVRIACHHILLNMVWEGLAQGQWGETELVELQKLLGPLDFIGDYQWSMRGERAFGNYSLDQLRRGTYPYAKTDPNDPAAGLMRLVRLSPTGLLYQNQICASRISQDHILPMSDPASRRFHINPSTSIKDLPEFRRTTPYNALAVMLIPAIEKAAHKYAQSQVLLDQCRYALALERFRNAQHRYPEKLDELVPQFLPALVNDPMDGQPYRYRRTPEGRYLIYSVGLNGKDDGGKTVLKEKSSAQDVTQGDWVWQYPPEALLGSVGR